MCGRYSFSNQQSDKLSHTLGVDLSDIQPRFNLSPGQNNPVIYQTEKRPLLAAFKWGLVPHWLKEPKTRYSTINAKMETVAQKPFYRDAYHTRRCLVRPMAGMNGEKSRPESSRITSTERRGIRSPAYGSDGRIGNTLDTYTLITGQAV
ncbi:MAG: SOS response-associated peptidase family protein [Gammaproteobacteria bacterium]|nr:SOS response-associated peptidase family protein [Gammaproteobacteria bacterium]